MVRCTALGGAVACPRALAVWLQLGATAPDSFTPPSFVTDLLQPELC